MNQIHDSMTIAISCKHIYLIRSVLSSSRLHAAYQLISSGPSKLATLFQSLGYSNCLPDFFYPVAETWRRVWGDGQNFRGPRFLNDVLFGQKCPFSRQKFLMICFFSHRPDFSDFPFLLPDFPYAYYVKCRT